MSLKHPFPFSTSTKTQNLSGRLKPFSPNLSQLKNETLQQQLDDLSQQQQRLKSAANVVNKPIDSFIKARSKIVEQRIADLQTRLKK